RDAEGAYLVPISYAYEDGAIYAHAAPGRKLTLMRRWPHVALQVDDVQNGATWRSVILQGKFEELMDEEARTKARMLLLRAFAGDPLSATAGHGHRTTLADAVMFRVKAEQITGRAENM
ncbi:MAG: hypothetical protein FJ317_07640, partial [SAR202 cluster bacterium]|nr:hypothetical protein [SAR202 cluster bacterium]